MKSREANDRGRVRLRLVEVDVEGNSSAILEGLRSITAALQREAPKTVGGGLPPRPLSPQVRAATPLPNGELFPEVAAETEVAAIPSDADEPGTNDAQSTKPAKPRRYPNCKLLDLELERGSTSFRAFVETKQPKTDLERYMVCAHWLKKERGLTAITNDHVFTCYQAMQWKPQKDVGQPFRKMKNKNFVQNADGQWSLHSNGEVIVGRLPARE